MTYSATLGRQIHERALRTAHLTRVEEVQAYQKIDYYQDKQVNAVLEILKLVAHEPAVAIFTHIITSFNQVMTCCRQGNEKVTLFVSRFWRLAAEHLMLVYDSPSSQVGEVVAITLLSNSILPEAALTNANLELITRSENSH